MAYPVNLVILSVLIVTTLTQKQVNDECTIPGGKQGKCLRLANCPSAVEAVIKKKKLVNCGFEGIHPIVCCESFAEKKVGKTAKQNCLKYSQMIITDSLANGTEESVTIDPNAEKYPYMVALGYGETEDIHWRCGGTLISEKYVLTAAHCLNSLHEKPVKHVRLGDPTQNLKVARTFKHPEYKPRSYYNDIALIELSSDAVLNKYVQPACLQTETEISETNWSVSGWDFRNLSSNLENVPIKPYTLEECQRTYSATRKLKNGIDFNLQLCAGAVKSNECDAGTMSPLKVGDRIVIGVPSFGKSCAFVDIPTVFTKVSYYIGWIEPIVWPQ